MSKENMLMTIQPSDLAIGFFTKADGPDAIIDAVRAMANDFKPDFGGDTWQEEVRSFAYKITRTRTTIDNAGKELVAEYKEIPRLIDATRRRLREELDAIRDEVRKPLTELEEDEKARIQGHEYNIRGMLLRLECEDLDLQELELNIDWINSVEVDESWDEFQAEAQAAKDQVLVKLMKTRDDLKKRLAEQAELERLRAEAAKREQEEREARIAQEASEKARLEKELAEKREAEAKAEAERQVQLAKERAEREVKEAVEAERKRQEQEAQAKKEAEAKRQAEIAHRGRVHAEIMADMAKAGLGERQAGSLLNSMRSNEIRNVKIIY